MELISACNPTCRSQQSPALLLLPVGRRTRGCMSRERQGLLPSKPSVISSSDQTNQLDKAAT